MTENNISRRKILRKGTATGALVVGGATASGSVAASGHCNMRIEGVDDEVGDGGRQVTVSDITRCTTSNLRERTFTVKEEVPDGPGLCPEQPGKRNVRHYEIMLAGSIRTLSVTGALPVDSTWRITGGSRC